MKKNRFHLKYKTIFLLTIVLMMFILCSCTKEKSNEVMFRQSANSSSGSYWEYSLSNENVLQETEYTTSTFFLNFGPGYQQNWTFEVIGAGEVTIDWLAYQGSFYDEEASYSVTYIFDNDGNFQAIQSEPAYQPDEE